MKSREIMSFLGEFDEKQGNLSSLDPSSTNTITKNASFISHFRGRRGKRILVSSTKKTQMAKSSLLSLLLVATTLWTTMALSALPNNHTGDFAVEGDSDADVDGGFSSLDSMLQWAIGHSDPAKLKQSAEQLSGDELNKRQLELKQVVEQLRAPSDAELMRAAIQDLRNTSSSPQDRRRALNDLLILAESLDNANDLHKLGGLGVVIQELNHADPETRKLAAWILGEASQNNLVVQNQVLGLGALPKLMKMVKSDVVEEANKGLYAVSALVRDNANGRLLFYAEAGALLLEDLLGNPKTDIRLRKKAVFLVGGLAESRLESLDDKDAAPFFSRPLLLKSVVDLTASSDLDLQEKALMAIRNVMQLETSEGAAILKELCGLKLDVALERMRQQLIERSKTGEEYERDFVMDLESLRSQVEVIFRTRQQR